jgi:hypothetical protein
VADVLGVDLAPVLGRVGDFLLVIPAGDQMVKTALEFDATLPCHSARDDSRNIADSQTLHPSFTSCHDRCVNGVLFVITDCGSVLGINYDVKLSSARGALRRIYSKRFIGLDMGTSP